MEEYTTNIKKVVKKKSTRKIPIHEIIEKQMKSVSASAIMDLLREKMETATKKELNELLSTACSSNKWSLQLIECIIEAGADPHHSNDEPFLRSCECYNTDFTIPSYFLNEHNANINAQNSTAFERAFMCENFVVAGKLLESGLIIKDLDVLLESFEYNEDELIKILIDNGFDPEVVTRKLLVHRFQLIDDDENDVAFIRVYKQAKKYLTKEELGQLLVETIDKSIDEMENSYDSGSDNDSSRSRSPASIRSRSPTPARTRIRSRSGSDTE